MPATRETDRAAWASATASLLEDHDFESLDIAGVAEEMRLLSAADYRELQSRLRTLIIHLLKWSYQPRKRSRSGLVTIGTQRVEIETLLEQSPQPADTSPAQRPAKDLAQSGRSGGHADRDRHREVSQRVRLKTETLADGWLPPKV